MNSDRILSSISAVAASIAAIAAVWNVNEVNKQRETTFRPELVFSRFDFSAKPMAKDNPVPLAWQAIGQSSSDDKQNDFLTCLRITNVGLGAAKNVRIEWSFEFEKSAAYVNVLAQMSNYSLVINKRSSISSLDVNNDTKIGFHSQGELLQNIGYIFPGAQNTGTCVSSIPVPYKVVASSLIFLSSKTGDMSLLNKIPELRSKVTYEDIGGNVYSTRHRFAINVDGFGENYAFGSLVEKPL